MQPTIHDHDAGYQNVYECGTWKGASDVTVAWNSGGNVYWGGRIVDTRADGHCVSAWRKYGRTHLPAGQLLSRGANGPAAKAGPSRP